MRTILASLALLGLVAFSRADDAEARARACYTLAMAEEVGELAAAPSDAIAFDLRALKVPTGRWQTVRVCDGNGFCHEEQRWVKDRTVASASGPLAVAAGDVSTPSDPSAVNDALDELNAQRAQRGLRAYVRDPLLTLGAQACANVRAAARRFGHTRNDFSYLPAGASATYAGCAAWQPGSGFGACGVYDNFTYAGAAFAIGPDGLRYMHAFYR